MRTFTRREAAEYLGVSTRTLDRWRKAGKITETHALGRGRRGGPRFTKKALDKLPVDRARGDE